VGTSSLRRSAQLLHRAPICHRSLAGQLDTRLKKLESESLDAIVLAAAGVRRWDWPTGSPRSSMNRSCCPPWARAPCASRSGKTTRVLHRWSPLDDLPTRQVVMGERAFLNRLEGGCQVPIAGHGHIDDNGLHPHRPGLRCGRLPSIKQTRTGPETQSEEIGLELAESLLARGAGKILERLNANAVINQQAKVYWWVPAPATPA
jgi:hydroxymethylbilane synthase